MQIVGGKLNLLAAAKSVRQSGWNSLLSFIWYSTLRSAAAENSYFFINFFHICAAFSDICMSKWMILNWNSSKWVWPFQWPPQSASKYLHRLIILRLCLLGCVASCSTRHWSRVSWVSLQEVISSGPVKIEIKDLMFFSSSNNYQFWIRFFIFFYQICPQERYLDWMVRFILT